MDGRKKTLVWVLALIILVSASFIFVKPNVFAAFYVNRGDNYLSKNDYNSAFSSYYQALKENPNSYSAYVGRAKSNLHLKQAPAALLDINQAMSLGADSSEAHYVRGVVLAANNHHLLAISEYRLIIHREPSSPLAHLCTLNIARSYDRLKDFQSAIIAYNQYIKESKADDPQISQAKALLAESEKRAAEKPSEWEVFAVINSMKDLKNIPVDRYVLDWASADRSSLDVINLKFPEAGWLLGIMQNKQHYVFIRDNETPQKTSRMLSVTFVTAEKHLSVSQFSENYLTPIRSKPELRSKIVSSTKEEAYLEVVGAYGYGLTRVIKGTASIIVISYYTKIPNEAQKVFADKLVRGIAYSNEWPKDSPPQPKLPLPKPSLI